ncbi:MAG: polysaccharide deacetylase [Bosea sp. (in: a-proteobacteria)]
MSEAVCALLRELDAWRSAQRPIRLWLRDDDAIAPGPALDRLAGLAAQFRLPVLLAVIPMLAEPDLAADLAEKPLLLPCQHGAWHRNHGAPGARKSEFGVERTLAEVEAAIGRGRKRLADLLGEAVLPIFVPPWNRIAPDHAARLPALGFAGLSCFRGFRLGPAGGPRLGHTDLDIMDWQGGRIGRGLDDMAAELAATLAARRAAEAGGTAIGLLLHHRDHDLAGWDALAAMLALLTEHQAVTATNPRMIFGLA